MRGASAVHGPFCRIFLLHPIALWYLLRNDCAIFCKRGCTHLVDGERQVDNSFKKDMLQPQNRLRCFLLIFVVVILSLILGVQGCSLSVDSPPSTVRLDAGGDEAPKRVADSPPVSATLVKAPTATPTPEPEPFDILLPRDLEFPLRQSLQAVSARDPRVRFAPSFGGRNRPAGSIVWAMESPEGAVLLREEPYVAATHVLSLTVEASWADLVGWASGAQPGPRLVVGDDGAAVKTLLGLERLAPNTIYVPDLLTAKQYVSTHPGTWALLPWRVVDATVHALTVEGRRPDPRHMEGYPLVRRLWLVPQQPLPGELIGALQRTLAYRAEPVVELVAVGDVMLARLVGERIAQKGARYPFEGEGIQPLIDGADIAFGNLECPISTRGKRQDKGIEFRADPAVLEGLTYAGFDILSLANNHTGDYGDEALLDTLAYLEEAGILAVGAGETITSAHRLQVIESNGLRVGFLAYNEIPPRWFAAKGDSPGSAFGDPEALRAEVTQAREETDVVIVSYHWGTEYTPYPTPSQRATAQALAEAGADLVIGHHPHVVQGVGYYPSTFVAFSLGNFIFDQEFSDETQEGLILRCLLDKTGVKTVELLGHRITRSQPSLAAAEEARPMLERMMRVAREQHLLPGEGRSK